MQLSILRRSELVTSPSLLFPPRSEKSRISSCTASNLENPDWIISTEPTGRWRPKGLAQLGWGKFHTRSKYNPGEILIIDTVAIARPGPEHKPDHSTLGRGGAHAGNLVSHALVRSRGLRAAPSPWEAFCHGFFLFFFLGFFSTAVFTWCGICNTGYSPFPLLLLL
ncbi:hypothetical protein BDW42DRAFT_118347 [Aspergillus taichungensis]|uniref:Uncharacterized protein n=1 Tax=Aspergillus taichungensis TaxID=482145 RepID=A0A2J5HRI5_9EURO|nr:hypothetical protein BDW42DRAFT_118347 [Aspergillus taichungensis]